MKIIINLIVLSVFKIIFSSIFYTSTCNKIFEDELVDCYETVNIKIKHNKKYGLYSGTFINIYDERGIIYNDFTYENEVVFSFKFKCGQKYRIQTFNKYYIIEERTYLSSSLNSEEKEILLNAKINPRFQASVFINSPDKNKTIYFSGKGKNIDCSSRLLIDKMINYLKHNNDENVVIQSYTDSRRCNSFNLKLTKSRAEKVKLILMNNNIEESRIKIEYFGETQLTNKCSNGVKCSQKQHEKNNRITFRVIKKQ